MDPNLDSLKTSGDPWKSWQSSWDWLRLFAASYFDRCPRSSLLQRTGGPWKQLGVKKKPKQQKPNKTQEHAATTMKAGSTKALISKDIRSQQKYSSSTLVSHLCYFCTVQFKAGLQCSSPQLRGKLCQQSIACQQPKAHFCVCSKQNGNANAMGSKAPLQGKEPLCKAPHLSSGLLQVQEFASTQLRACPEHRVSTHPLQPDPTSHPPQLTPSSNTTSVHNSECFQEQTCKHAFEFCTWKGKKKTICTKKIYPKLFGNGDPLPGFISSKTGVLKSTLRNILCFYSHKTVRTFNACHAK